MTVQRIPTLPLTGKILSTKLHCHKPPQLCPFSLKHYLALRIRVRSGQYNFFDHAHLFLPPIRIKEFLLKSGIILSSWSFSLYNPFFNS